MEFSDVVPGFRAGRTSLRDSRLPAAAGAAQLAAVLVWILLLYPKGSAAFTLGLEFHDWMVNDWMEGLANASPASGIGAEASANTAWEAVPAPVDIRDNPAVPPQNLPKTTEPERPAVVTIRVDQTSQQLSVSVQGRTVDGLDSVPVSTGLPEASKHTPDGIFWINPREVKERRQSFFASGLLKRPVFLTHAIQIVGGIFMHDASEGAMPHLGRKRSYGCVRVDRRKMPAIFRLVKQHPFHTRVHIFHQGS
jgi:hypothetical protein